jgi:hypothetical protein
VFVLLLLVGGLIYGSAAFAGSHVFVFAGIALALWLVALGGRSAWRLIAGPGAPSGNR